MARRAGRKPARRSTRDGRTNRKVVAVHSDSRFSRFVGMIRRMNRRSKLIAFGGAAAILAAIVVTVVLTTGASAARQASLASLPTPTSAPTLAPLPTPEPTPIPTTPPEPTIDPVLTLGDESDRVMALQSRLMDLGYLDIDDATMLFGSSTEYAVQLFQRQHELEQDGIVGQDTMMIIFGNGAQSYTLLNGTEGTDVDGLQRQLERLGYLDRVTGYYGTETEAAVKAFQKRNSLEVDGKTGPKTLDMIYSPEAKASAYTAQARRARANILEMVEVARDQLGKRYVLGNEGPNSFDCSGLVYYCLRVAGSSRGRYNAAGYSRVSDWEKIESMNDMEIGDLIFFWSSSSKTRVGHVAIYVGRGMMIDASTSNGKVVRRSCRTSYWERMFNFARRPW